MDEMDKFLSPLDRENRGGARGGPGGYSPRRKDKSDFFGYFWHL